MDGILLINKPVGITSRDAVNALCKKLGTKKIGHTGTLDPFAEGLLVCTINKGTKCGPFLEEQTKTYVASLKLGIETDSYDKDGEIIKTCEVPLLSIDDIEKVLKSFEGEISQTVPLYSAIKKDGKRLCDYAREGKEVDCPSRVISIFDIKLINYNKEENIIDFEVTCSKGTYVRTLGHDIAIKLNTVGHLISLKRIRVGNFALENSYNLENVDESKIISVYEALANSLPSLEVNDIIATDLKNGKHLIFKGLCDKVFVYDSFHNPICIIERDHQDVYKVTRGLF